MSIEVGTAFLIIETIICVPLICYLIAANREGEKALDASNKVSSEACLRHAKETRKLKADIEAAEAKVYDRERKIKALTQEVNSLPQKINLAVSERIAQSPKLDLFLQQRDPTLRKGFFDSERTRQIAMAFFDNTLDDFIAKTNYWSRRTEERIHALKERLSTAELENVTLKAELTHLHELFPDLPEYIEIEEEKEKVDQEAKGSDWLMREEWSSLSECVRNQLALDRYVASRKKTKWQIGRDFELYVGHRYRTHGFQVQQFGIERGLEDLGRDLICTKDGKTAIVQCKCWAAEKTIHEKHINQLFGTAVEFAVRNNIKIEAVRAYDLFPEMLAKANIIPVFATTAQLSKTAEAFANILGVKVKRVKPGWEAAFPRIKCNIGKDGSKIYHLPFDQQYDATVIEPEKGECYAQTCAEAEAKGFRRAWRFHGI